MHKLGKKNDFASVIVSNSGHSEHYVTVNVLIYNILAIFSIKHQRKFVL